MRDQAAIHSFARYSQGGDRVAYFFGDTAVTAEEWEDVDGDIHLRPIMGAQISCDGWNDLPDDVVAAYCELLEDEMRRRNC